MRARVLPALALAAALGACAGAAPAPGAGPAPVGDRIYVTIQDGAAVTILDASTHEIIETVDLRALGFSAGARPHHVVADPDGSHWYVSLIGESRVLKLDAATNRVVGQAEFEVAGMLAYDPDSHRLFVGRSMSAVNPPQRIGVIDRRDMSVEEIAVLFPRPHALTTNPRSVHAYSASLATNQMATIDPVEEDVRIQAFMEPTEHEGHGAGHEMMHTLVDFAISPDGRTLVGTAEMTGQLLVFDLADPGRPRLAHRADVGTRPWHPAYSPDGREVWIPSMAANTVTVVRTSDWEVAEVIRGAELAAPYGAAFSPDGRWVFVSNSDARNELPGEGGTVAVIDAASRRIVEVIPVGPNPTGVGTRARP